MREQGPVFVKIYTNRAKLTPTDNIIAYLMVALKNTLFNALKKTSDSFSLDEADEKEDQSEEHFSTPETIYINKEQEKNTHMKVHAMMSSRLPRRSCSRRSRLPRRSIRGRSTRCCRRQIGRAHV